MIDNARLRGAQQGHAQISQIHPNFLINTSGTTTADLERLGKEVQKRVFQASGISLEQEIMRMGDSATNQPGETPEK